MIWGMTIGTWLYYFALPWSTFIFTVIYGFYWLLSPKYRGKDITGSKNIEEGGDEE